MIDQWRGKGYDQCRGTARSPWSSQPLCSQLTTHPLEGGVEMTGETGMQTKGWKQKKQLMRMQQRNGEMRRWNSRVHSVKHRCSTGIVQRNHEQLQGYSPSLGRGFYVAPFPLVCSPQTICPLVKWTSIITTSKRWEECTRAGLVISRKLVSKRFEESPLYIVTKVSVVISALLFIKIYKWDDGYCKAIITNH